MQTRNLILIHCITIILPSCTIGNHTFVSPCYKTKYDTLLLDSTRTVKKIIKDDCYKKPQIIGWHYHKTIK